MKWWVYLFVFMLSLLFVGLIIFSVNRRVEIGGPYQNNTQGVVGRYRTLFVYVLNNDRDYTQRDHDKKEISYWKWSIVVSISSVLVTGMAALFAFDAYIEAKSQADTAEKSLESGERPWIGAPKIEVIQDSDGVRFLYFFENVGHSPPSGMYIDARIVSAREGWEEVTNEMCLDGERKARTQSEFYLYSIVPGADFRLDYTPSRGKKTYSVDNINGMLNPNLAGCIVYKGDDPSKIFMSKFVGPVSIKDGKVVVPFMYTISPK